MFLIKVNVEDEVKSEQAISWPSGLTNHAAASYIQ